jgi:hypothetical protein
MTDDPTNHREEPMANMYRSRFVPSPHVLGARAPRPPEVLVATRQDDGPMAPRPARSVRYRKVKRGS